MADSARLEERIARLEALVLDLGLDFVHHGHSGERYAFGPEVHRGRLSTISDRVRELRERLQNYRNIELCRAVSDVSDGPYGTAIPWLVCDLPKDHAGPHTEVDVKELPA